MGDHPAAGARARLEAAAAGLLFLSESEAPLEYVEAARPPGATTSPAERVAQAFGERGPARESSVAGFFAGHIGDVDPADAVQQSHVPRFQSLVTAIEEELREPRVYCFGEVEKRCYVVGEVGSVLAGVRTVVWET